MINSTSYKQKVTVGNYTHETCCRSYAMDEIDKEIDLSELSSFESLKERGHLVSGVVFVTNRVLSYPTSFIGGAIGAHFGNLFDRCCKPSSEHDILEVSGMRLGMKIGAFLVCAPLSLVQGTTAVVEELAYYEHPASCFKSSYVGNCCERAKYAFMDNVLTANSAWLDSRVTQTWIRDILSSNSLRMRNDIHRGRFILDKYQMAEPL